MTAGDAAASGPGRAAGVDRGDPLLVTRNLTKQFGPLTAVDGVDLTVGRGETRGLIGPNGAGKTTVFRLVSGLLYPTTGTIEFDGTDVTDWPPHRRARAGVAQALQVESVFPGLTVRENVLGAVNATRGRLSPAARFDAAEAAVADAREAMAAVGVEGLADRTVSELSHGDRKRLELALALATDPDLLLLDEPTAGLSAGETSEVGRLVESLHGDLSILLVEHDVDLVLEVADRITVLHEGAVLSEGSPEAVAADQRVQEVYMGR